MKELGTLSLQSLQVLDTLLRTRSVSRTADTLGQTQSAISVVLRRLRQQLGDALLVRDGNQMVLTQKAQHIHEDLHGRLLALTQLLEARAPFDPDTAQQTFNIASADCVQTLFLPRLASQLRQRAPHIRLRLGTVDPSGGFSADLAEGRLDAIIGNWLNPPEHLRCRKLLEDRMVCLMRPGHAFADREALTLEDYLALQHVAPDLFISSRLGPVDGALARVGARRNIAVTVPEFGLATYLVADSDLVFTASSHYGYYFAELMGLVVVEAPAELDPMQFYLLWHERTQREAACIWLREQIMDVASLFDA
ncbi:LysR family transcriptional regulator [Corticibacter populi]|uniref:LysR family transcriptional regulator n=1 Tax=Corticibacter populi TaxID=1550736 RepID=A0A3M6QSB9_9BURK|nr:LysR family transcriptional regulator [Corticibacter populi]RMX05925.1 LysR family transcriptional regulator [Corticibacter populi]RZS30753.1 LysR family transcriptional regulator [Corticibacter populi]